MLTFSSLYFPVHLYPSTPRVTDFHKDASKEGKQRERENLRLLPAVPVLHAEGVHVDDARLAVAQDVVELHVEPAGLLPEHAALRLHVLQLVRRGLHVVLHLLHLETGSQARTCSSENER